MTNKKNLILIENYFEVFLILSLFVAFILMIRGYLMALFLAAVFVFMSYGFYQKLLNRIKSKNVSALFIIFVSLTLILLPGYLVVINLIAQSSSLIVGTTDLISNYDFNSCSLPYCMQIANNLEVINLKFDNLISNIGYYISDSASAIINSVSNFFLDFFMFVIAFYFMLVDGDKFLVYVKRFIPMKSEYKRALFIRFRDVSEAVFFDNIFVALMQGFLLGVGFWIFGIKAFVFWGLIASFFALFPMVGTAIIWVPAFIYVLMNNPLWFSILFMLYNMIIVGLSDNLVRPMLLKKKMQIHSFIILIGILGGIEVFGFFGIFIGPLIISLLISVVQLYKLDFD